MSLPSITYLFDAYRFEWPDDGISIVCDRLHEEKAGLSCELEVRTALEPSPGLVRQGRFNLSAPLTRAQWVRALDERLPGPDWYAVFEQVCFLAIRRWREGEPIIDLADVEARSGLPFLLPPFIVEGASSLVFAEGGAGKSMFALACGLAVATGSSEILGMEPSRIGPVLYLDYEWDPESHAERLRALCAGYGIDVPHGFLLYRRETSSIMEGAAAIRRHIAETGAVLVIVDSLGMARGGEPESADLTIKVFGAIRSFGVPTLVLDHVVKNQTNTKYSFGSVYTTNAARITWRMDASSDGDGRGYRIGLSNQKANGRYQQPRGYTIWMDNSEEYELLSARYTPTDIMRIPAMADHIPLWRQCIEHLRAGPLTMGELFTSLKEEGIAVNSNVLRATLPKYKEIFTYMGGKWCLLDTNRGEESDPANVLDVSANVSRDPGANVR